MPDYDLFYSLLITLRDKKLVFSCRLIIEDGEQRGQRRERSSHPVLTKGGSVSLRSRWQRTSGFGGLSKHRRHHLGQDERGANEAGGEQAGVAQGADWHQAGGADKAAAGADHEGGGGHHAVGEHQAVGEQQGATRPRRSYGCRPWGGRGQGRGNHGDDEDGDLATGQGKRLASKVGRCETGAQRGARKSRNVSYQGEHLNPQQ